MKTFIIIIIIACLVYLFSPEAKPEPKRQPIDHSAVLRSYLTIVDDWQTDAPEVMRETLRQLYYDIEAVYKFGATAKDVTAINTRMRETHIALSNHQNQSKMYYVKSSVPTIHQMGSIYALMGGPNVRKDPGGSYSAEVEFENEDEARDFLRSRLSVLFNDTDMDEAKYQDSLNDIEKDGRLYYDAAMAEIVTD